MARNDRVTPKEIPGLIRTPGELARALSLTKQGNSPIDLTYLREIKTSSGQGNEVLEIQIDKNGGPNRRLKCGVTLPESSWEYLSPDPITEVLGPYNEDGGWYNKAFLERAGYTQIKTLFETLREQGYFAHEIEKLLAKLAFSNQVASQLEPMITSAFDGYKMRNLLREQHQIIFEKPKKPRIMVHGMTGNFEVAVGSPGKSEYYVYLGDYNGPNLNPENPKHNSEVLEEVIRRIDARLKKKSVGAPGVEPGTSVLSGPRSNQVS